MNQVIRPSTVYGSLEAPPSKSFAQRAVILASLARGVSTIFGIGSNHDVAAAIDASRTFGATVTNKGNSIEISGTNSLSTKDFNCGESGFLLRGFAPILATFGKEVIISGMGSLMQRDQGFLLDSLKAFGVECKSNGGKLPISIRGPFKRNAAIIDGSQGSQVLSGILMAAPLTEQSVEIWVNDLKSKRYIDLTTDLMKLFGVEVQNKNYQSFFVPGDQIYKPASLVVEGDWSASAFFLVSGAVAGNVVIRNLKSNSHQPDKAIVDVLRDIGANVEIRKETVSVSKKLLKPFKFDATNCPDLFPPLVALAANCKGVSTIRGVGRLANKESDRASALISIFGKMGVDVVVSGEEMYVNGGNGINGCEVLSYNDHRIVMSAAVAALNAIGPITILGSDAVAKSYPEFFGQLRVLCNGEAVWQKNDLTYEAGQG